MVRLGRLQRKNRALVKKLSIRGNKTRHLHHWYNRQFPMSVFERKCKTPCYSYLRLPLQCQTCLKPLNMIKSVVGLADFVMCYACYMCYTTKSLCRSVHRSVGRSAGPAFAFSAFCEQFSRHRSCPIACYWCCCVYTVYGTHRRPCPYQPLLPLPNCTRLMLPCIRPC